MRGLVCTLALVGCSFRHGALADGAGVGPTLDTTSVPDAKIDSPGRRPDVFSAPACQTSDASLVWCLEFDEPGLANAASAIDSSGLNHDPAIANVAVTTRPVPASSQAIVTSASSSITLMKPNDFDLQQFTLSAWIARASSAELGIIDTSKQYTLSVSSFDHTVECAVSTGTQTISYSGVSVTAVNEWDLVACTYDGAQVCTYSFRNGSAAGQAGCKGRSSSTATSGTTTTVGEWADSTTQFVGGIDQVRIYGRALSQQELCIAGGLTGC